MDELIALYDAAGRECGSASRSQMRAHNLRHAATVVGVIHPDGRIYVHRRTETKDVFPGLHDFACGGVLGAGEEPAAAAARELAEELGIIGAPLTPLGEADYADAHTDYRAFRFEVVWDGPIRWQPEEVAWGDWMDPADVLRQLAAADAGPEALPNAGPDAEARAGWVPDTCALMRDWLSHRVAASSEPPSVGDSPGEHSGPSGSADRLSG